MSKKICGHERETLRWALQELEVLPYAFAVDSAERFGNRHIYAVNDVHDTDGLAEIMAEVLRGFWAPPVYTVSVSWSDALNMRIVINVDHNGRFGTVDGSHGWTMVSARAITLKLLSCTSTDEALAALEAT